MSPFVKKTSIIAGSTAAVAASGAFAWLLYKRGPKRRAFRDSVGWTPAYVPSKNAAPDKGALRTFMTTAAANKPGPNAGPKSDAGAAKPKRKSMPIESADPNPKPGVIGALKETYYEFAADDVMTQAAALAFYSGLAFAPLLTVAVWVMRVFFGSASKEKVASAFQQVIGSEAAKPLKDLLNPASDQASAGMTIAGIVSIVLVAFSASGVFGQVQSALNVIWHVQSKPANGLIGFIKKRFLSLGMLGSILFLLMTSLVVSTVLQGFMGTHDAGAAAVLWSSLNNTLSVGLFTVLFALLFKYVPDAKIGWKPVWIGGLLSAILFSVGKFGLAFYLGRGSYENSYGAAVGSFVALLVWVYYSAVILLLGAEATEVYARRHGEALQPDEHAVRVTQKTEAP